MAQGFIRSTLVAALLLLAALPAHGHARLTLTEPADGAVLAAAPAALRLVFSEQIETQFSRFALVRLAARERADDGLRKRLADGIAGNALPDGTLPLKPSQAERRSAEIALAVPQPLAPGRYVLVWRVLSVDGHHTGGTVAFEIAAGGG